MEKSEVEDGEMEDSKVEESETEPKSLLDDFVFPKNGTHVPTVISGTVMPIQSGIDRGYRGSCDCKLWFAYQITPIRPVKAGGVFSRTPPTSCSTCNLKIS